MWLRRTIRDAEQGRQDDSRPYIPSHSAAFHWSSWSERTWRWHYCKASWAGRDDERGRCFCASQCLTANHEWLLLVSVIGLRNLHLQLLTFRFSNPILWFLHSVLDRLYYKQNIKFLVQTAFFKFFKVATYERRNEARGWLELSNCVSWKSQLPMRVPCKTSTCISNRRTEIKGGKHALDAASYRSFARVDDTDLHLCPSVRTVRFAETDGCCIDRLRWVLKAFHHTSLLGMPTVK